MTAASAFVGLRSTGNHVELLGEYSNAVGAVDSVAVTLGVLTFFVGMRLNASTSASINHVLRGDAFGQLVLDVGLAVYALALSLAASPIAVGAALRAPDLLFTPAGFELTLFVAAVVALWVALLMSMWLAQRRFFAGLGKSRQSRRLT